jgi:soluble lytic murein transglycosylase-like protein
MSPIRFGLSLARLIVATAIGLSVPASAEDQPERASVQTATYADAFNAKDPGLTAIVDRYAAAAGVPVALARAVARIESDLNPQLTGRAGEVGLMQIKHETARGMGFTGSRAELYDAETNVRWGVRYLAEAWRLANGDTCRTVLKYLAGLTADNMTAAASAYCAKARKIMGEG